MLLFFLACTSETKESIQEVPLECEVGSHAVDDHCEASLSGWESGPSLLSARDHHVSVVAETDAGPGLYALAGTNKAGGGNTKVEQLLLGADSWSVVGELPEGRIGPGMAQLGNSLILAGGLLGDGTSTTATWVVQIKGDGSIQVEDGPELGISRYHVALAYAEGFVYAVGGLNQTLGDRGVEQEVLSSVERASFDGQVLGVWEEIGALPKATTHHGLVFYNGALYLFGGGDGMSARTTVLRSAVAADGSLGAWMEVGDMPEGRASPAVSVFLDQVYVVAGMTGLASGEVDTVLRGRFTANGTVGEWEELPSVPQARAHSHQVPIYEGVMYSVGGSVNHVDQGEVYLGRLE